SVPLSNSETPIQPPRRNALARVSDEPASRYGDCSPLASLEVWSFPENPNPSRENSYGAHRNPLYSYRIAPVSSQRVQRSLSLPCLSLSSSPWWLQVHSTIPTLKSVEASFARQLDTLNGCLGTVKALTTTKSLAKLKKAYIRTSLIHLSTGRWLSY